MKIDIFNTDKKYNIIYADPPWKYDVKGCKGAAEKIYPTMTVKEMATLPINSIANDDSVLLMWATYPKMQDALDLIKEWGFTYKSVAFQWVKQNKSGNGYFFGLGHWTRGNTEPCLIAIRGKPKRASASVGQLIFSPLRNHSQKPNQAREKAIELVGNVPRIELFARQHVDGWDCWGNEV